MHHDLLPNYQTIVLQTVLPHRNLLSRPINAIAEFGYRQSKLIRAFFNINKPFSSSHRDDLNNNFASLFFSRRLMTQEKYHSLHNVNLQQQKTVSQTVSIATYKDEPMFHIDYSSLKTHPPGNN
eukprot:c13821_g1_i1 orf=432-803(-)